MVLEKIAVAQTGNGINTKDRLEQIYQNMKINIQNQIGKDEVAETNAKKLSSFLTMLKRASKKGSVKKLTNNDFQGFFEVEEQKAVKKLLDRLERASMHIKDGVNKSIFSSNYFNNFGDGSNADLGVQLERGMAQVMKSFEALNTGKTYDSTGTYNVGGAHFQPANLEKIADNVAKEEITKIYNYIGNKLKEYKGDPEIVNLGYIPSVQGKIDTNGLSADITISSNTKENNKLLLEMTEILKDATFTNKNYINKDIIHFGQTNPVRMYMAVNGGIDGFWRMMGCLTYTHHAETPQLLYRIRALYELTGYNSIYTNQNYSALNGKIAKYLVWNNPLDGTVKVISISSIMNNIIDKLEAKDYKQALYGSIDLSQKVLNNL